MEPDLLVARVSAMLKNPGMTKVFLAHLAGVHRNTLENYDSPSWNPTKRTLDAIARAVDGLERAQQ